MKKRLVALALVLMMVLCYASALAEDMTLTFKQNSELELFNEDGVKLYLTGEVEDAGGLWLQLNAVVENQTDSTVYVMYSGNCNGWSIKEAQLGGPYCTANAHAKAKAYICLFYDDLEIRDFYNLESLNLSFDVCSGDKTMFTKENVCIEFGGSASTVKRSYFEECSLLPDPSEVGPVGALYQSSYHASSVNGKASNISYTYSSMDDNVKTYFDEYIEILKEEGLTVKKGSGDSYTVSSSGKKLATVTYVNKTIQVEIATSN